MQGRNPESLANILTANSWPPGEAHSMTADKNDTDMNLKPFQLHTPTQSETISRRVVVRNFIEYAVEEQVKFGR